MMALPDPIEFIRSLPIGDYRPTYIEIPFPTCSVCGQPRHSPLFDDDGNVALDVRRRARTGRADHATRRISEPD